MATLNQFQQYSQGENTVTNNMLLMFSMLYEINPKYYEDYLNGLIEENEYYQVIPIFRQQVNNQGNGFIDGHITIRPSTIIIETKIDGLEWIDKLLKYTDSFNPHEKRLLFHLSASKYDDPTIKKIKTILLSGEITKGVQFFSLTYEDLLLQLELLNKQYPYEAQLNRLYNHFKDYCQNMNLLPANKHILRAMACGQSFDLNIKHQFYFDLANRGFSPFKYLGIYKDKSVQYIGKVENIIEANWDEQNGLDIKSSTSPVTDNQKDRLISAIIESNEEDWYLNENHKFFLLNEFTKTDFKKTSPGGIFRVRYFNLEEILGKSLPDNITEIANDLKIHTWE